MPKSDEPMVTNVRILAPAAALLLVCTHAQAQTAFTYQGQLKSGGSPANGSHNLVFRLCSTAAGPGGVLQTFPPPPGVVPVNVVNGLFTQELPFDAGEYDITFTPPFLGLPSVTAKGNAVGTSALFVVSTAITASTCRLVTFDESVVILDSKVHFIAIGPR